MIAMSGTARAWVIAGCGLGGVVVAGAAVVFALAAWLRRGGDG